MEKIILKDGTEREVPSQKELEELQFRSEERKKQREEERESKKKLQEELLKLTNKDYNFKNLKEKTKEKENEIAKKAKELDEARKVFIERQTLEYEQDALAGFNIDKKEKEKVLYYYNNELTAKAVTKKEIKEKMEKAYRLAIKPERYNPINQAINHQGRGSGTDVGKPESDVSREIRSKVFRTSDTEIKKYDKNWKPNI